MRPPSPRQRYVLDYIINYIHRLGFSPSLREICAHPGATSMTAAKDHLRALERKGYVDCGEKYQARGIKILANSHGEKLRFDMVADSGEDLLKRLVELKDRVSLLEKENEKLKSQRCLVMECTARRRDFN